MNCLTKIMEFSRSHLNITQINYSEIIDKSEVIYLTSDKSCTSTHNLSLLKDS